MNLNRTIMLLMVSDIFVVTGFGLIAPILAIFIKDSVAGGTILAAGFASTLYLITKSLIQLPFSRYVDSHDHKVKWLIVGTLIISLVPFVYMSANHINAIYVAQILLGVGSGFAAPTWLGLWSTHLSKKHESFEWSLYSTLTGLGTAATAAIGAVIAEFLGFAYTFGIVGIASLIGCFILFGLERKKERLDKARAEDYLIRRKLADAKHR